MSGASINEIKARIKSVGSTMQITRAMELVATSKLSRARESAEAADEFCRVYERAILPIIPSASEIFGIEKAAEGGRALYIVIAGDRGLAGGYNSNILGLTESLSSSEDAVFLAIGKKSTEHLHRAGKELLSEGVHASEVDMKYCMELSRGICGGFMEGKYSKVELIYTKFVSMLSQIPECKRLLPINNASFGDEAPVFDAMTDGDIHELASTVIPEYIGCILYRSICQATASESAARRSAMNSANKNAEQIIDSLMQNYNRARQAVITQEISEIVSGAGAL